MKLSLSAKMTKSRGSILGVPGFPSSSYFTREAKSTTVLQTAVGKLVANHRNIVSFAVQESSASAVAAETKKKLPTPAKPKPAAKTPAKPLPELMEEDVIPPLRAILEAQDDITDLKLAFGDNRLEGSFQKKGTPYFFWAFFPDGSITGPKGFSLSSYGSTVSSVEPFLVDEKKVTAKLLVFWVEKRLAAQGIIPVWKD